LHKIHYLELILRKMVHGFLTNLQLVAVAVGVGVLILVILVEVGVVVELQEELYSSLPQYGQGHSLLKHQEEMEEMEEHKMEVEVGQVLVGLVGLEVFLGLSMGQKHGLVLIT
jgi:xanthine/uracil/vitamin C permease (AzgA family)